VRTLRAKRKLLCQDWGRALRWNAELAKEWMARQSATELYFYCDGHVRVYHGEQTPLPRHDVARERLCLRATTDYWINAMDGPPLLYVNKEVDPGLIAPLKQDVIPWLEANLARTAEQERCLTEDSWAHCFTPGVRSGRLQSGAFPGSVAEANCRPDLSQVSSGAMAAGRIPLL
jgi:hypothetical protein